MLPFNNQKFRHFLEPMYSPCHACACIRFDSEQSEQNSQNSNPPFLARVLGKGMSGIAADTPERKKFLANRPSTLKNTKKIVDPETYDVTGYQCTVCDKVTAKYQTHHLHLKEHERVICKICHRTFQGLSNLMKHRQGIGQIEISALDFLAFKIISTVVINNGVGQESFSY